MLKNVFHRSTKNCCFPLFPSREIKLENAKQTCNLFTTSFTLPSFVPLWSGMNSTGLLRKTSSQCLFLPASSGASRAVLIISSVSLLLGRGSTVEWTEHLRFWFEVTVQFPRTFFSWECNWQYLLDPPDLRSPSSGTTVQCLAVLSFLAVLPLWTPLAKDLDAQSARPSWWYSFSKPPGRIQLCLFSTIRTQMKIFSKNTALMFPVFLAYSAQISGTGKMIRKDYRPLTCQLGWATSWRRQ